MDNNWPSARMVNVIDNEIRILNDTQNPIYIPKHEHLCQVRATYVVDPPKISSASDFKPKITKISSVVWSIHNTIVYTIAIK